MFRNNLENHLIKAKRVLFIIICLFWVLSCVSVVGVCVAKKHVYPLEYKQAVVKYANQNQISPALVFAIIKTESSFNPNALSSKGAVGLMQILPSTAEYVSKMIDEREYNLTDSTTNIRYGCVYLRYLINRFKKVKVALCAYNAGEGKVSGWLKDKRYSKDGITLEKIPYLETEKYIDKIQKSFTNYIKLYGKIVDNQSITM